MSRRLHFFRRGSCFYWRRRLPLRIAEIAGRSHLCRSLQTVDFREARQRALRLSLVFEEFMVKQELEIKANASLTREQMNQIVDDLFDRVLNECRHWAKSMVPCVAARTYENVEEFNADEERQLYELFRPDRLADLWQTQFELSDYGEAEWRLPALLEARGLSLPPDSPEFRDLAFEGMQVGIAALRDAWESLSNPAKSELVDSVRQRRQAKSSMHPVVQNPRATRQQSAVAPGLLISSFKDGFVAHNQNGGRWTNQTTAQNKNSIDLFVRIVGDKPIEQLRRADAEKFRRKLEQIPANFGKSPRHFEIPIEQVIAERNPEAQTLAVGTLNRHWNTIAAYIKWINRQDDVSPIDINRVFGGFFWDADVPGEEERLEWDDESLKKLFESPIWSGFSPDPERRYWRHAKGEVIERDEYWWVPLLGVFLGGREEEYLQLKGSDIYEIDGIPIIDVNGPHLKNKASERKIPIHSALLRLGFLDLARRAEGGLIFPSMPSGGRDNKRSYFYTEQFTQYRRKVGVYRRWMDYHSFRKNATTKMIRAGASILQADEITGHDSKQRKEMKETQSVTLDYFAGFELPQRREVVETIQYSSIDIEKILRRALSAKRAPW